LDFIAVFLDKLLNYTHFVLPQAIVCSQFDLRFKPVLNLSVSRLHVDVHSGFLAGQEEEAESLFLEYRWSHACLFGCKAPNASAQRRGMLASAGASS
jgi:hypothetical protein